MSNLHDIATAALQRAGFVVRGGDIGSDRVGSWGVPPHPYPDSFLSKDDIHESTMDGTEQRPGLTAPSGVALGNGSSGDAPPDTNIDTIEETHGTQKVLQIESSNAFCVEREGHHHVIRGHHQTILQVADSGIS